MLGICSFAVRYIIVWEFVCVKNLPGALCHWCSFELYSDGWSYKVVVTGHICWPHGHGVYHWGSKHSVNQSMIYLSFVIFPSDNTEVCLWISLWGNIVPVITISIKSQNSFNLSPLSLTMPIACHPITLLRPLTRYPTFAFISPVISNISCLITGSLITRI